MDKRDKSGVYDSLRILKTPVRFMQTVLRLTCDCCTIVYGLTRVWLQFDGVYGCATIHFLFLNMFKNFFSLPDLICSDTFAQDKLRITRYTLRFQPRFTTTPTYVQTIANRSSERRSGNWALGKVVPVNGYVYKYIYTCMT